MDRLINSFLSLLIAFFTTQSLNKDTNLIFTGDIMLGRSVMVASLKMNDPDYPFRKVADKLSKADIVFSNLETPIISKCPPSNAGFKFCADPKMVEGLKFAGVDIVNLANNHTLNYGEEGLIETEEILKSNGIKWVGEGNLVIIEKNGTKFGFLGFDFVDNKPSKANYQLIQDSKKRVDVLIPMIHWGTEYTPIPSNGQKLIANELVNSGADVVIGGHPHWVQNIDYINGKPVFYSLGNFIFDQLWSEETKHGLAVQLFYQNNKLSKIDKLPIYMKNFAQPEWVTK
ncbi:MAG TPA: CapA family protein [Patescibacteria group bacterium]|nr:CapA family protein [Patescibacteria group bacterium]